MGLEGSSLSLTKDSELNKGPTFGNATSRSVCIKGRLKQVSCTLSLSQSPPALSLLEHRTKDHTFNSSLVQITEPRTQQCLAKTRAGLDKALGINSPSLRDEHLPVASYDVDVSSLRFNVSLSPTNSADDWRPISAAIYSLSPNHTSKHPSYLPSSV